jgi:hypothetical protein
MTARDWRVAVFVFVLACALVFTFALAARVVNARRECAVRLASDGSWQPVNFDGALPPGGCRLVVTQVQEAQ